MNTIKPIEVALDHADAALLRHFQSEIAKAADGLISTEWLQRSYQALPANIKAIFEGGPK